MLLPFLLSTLLAQTPGVPLGPDWPTAPVRADRDKFEYAHYVRQESDGNSSEISASKQACNCMPAVFAGEMVMGLAMLPNVTIKIDQTSVCGARGVHFVATGIASAQSAGKNMDIYAFRQGDSIYAFRYFFTMPLPRAEDEALLLHLCPAQGA